MLQSMGSQRLGTTEHVCNSVKSRNLMLNAFATFTLILGFPGGSEGKASACNVGDLGSVPGSGRSPGEGKGNPLQHSCLENSTDRGAWQAIVQGVTKGQTPLSD